MSRLGTKSTKLTGTMPKQPSVKAFFQVVSQESTTKSEKSPVVKPTVSTTLRQRLRSTSERSQRTIGKVFKNVPKDFTYPRPDVVMTRQDLIRRADRMRTEGRTIEFLNFYEPRQWWQNLYDYHPKRYYNEKFTHGVVCSICDNQHWSSDSYTLIKETGKCSKCQASTTPSPPPLTQTKPKLKTILLSTADVVRMRLRT